MNKKAQIKFGETIGIIIIVYIIIMVGLTWFNSINNDEILNLREIDQKERAFEKYYFIVNLDLIHSSKRGNVEEEFDLESLKTFSNFSNNSGKEYIRKRLGESLIQLQVFSRNELINNLEPSINITLYNLTPSKNKKIINKEIFRTLIPVNDELNNENKIGLLKVTTYITAQK